MEDHKNLKKKDFLPSSSLSSSHGPTYQVIFIKEYLPSNVLDHTESSISRLYNCFRFSRVRKYFLPPTQTQRTLALWLWRTRPCSQAGPCCPQQWCVSFSGRSLRTCTRVKHSSGSVLTPDCSHPRSPLSCFRVWTLTPVVPCSLPPVLGLILSSLPESGHLGTHVLCFLQAWLLLGQQPPVWDGHSPPRPLRAEPFFPTQADTELDLFSMKLPWWRGSVSSALLQERRDGDLVGDCASGSPGWPAHPPSNGPVGSLC